MLHLALKTRHHWKKVAAVLCLTYCVLAWVFPIALLPFFNVLPYVHTANFAERMAVSCLGTAILILIMFCLSPRQFRSTWLIGTSFFDRLKGGLLSALGIAMFTFAGAQLSPNLLGALSRVLPAESFEEVTVVEEVSFSGSRYKSVDLSLRSQSSKDILFLVLSKRLFNYPVFKVGDVVTLYGRKTIAGVYVTNFSLVGDYTR